MMKTKGGNAMKRWIMHVDMDAFFASVEQRDFPEYRGKPVIIGGKSRRGVVATASYEARKYGVHSAMPVMQARELCPEGIFLPPRFDAYREASEQIHEIMLHYASAYEPISLDEAFLDISGMGIHYPTVGAVGRAIKKEIADKVRLTASVGIAPNKFLAKMASDMNKPDGLCIIPYGKEAQILRPLPVRRLWGVGEVTEKKLIRARFLTIGDIQDAPESRLTALLGSQGSALKRLAFGQDDRPVQARREIKSIGDESTYDEDLIDPDRIDREIAIHSDIVAQRLRKHRRMARTVSLKIRFASFTTVTRAVTLPESTSLQKEIYDAARALLRKIPRKEGIRLIGVACSNLGPEVSMASLFSRDREKKLAAERTIDEIQQKFGKEALRKGFWLTEEEATGKKSRKDSDDAETAKGL